MRDADRIMALVERLVAGDDLSAAEWKTLTRSKLFASSAACEALVLLVAGEASNTPSLGTFRTQIARHWLHALRRRSQWDCATWTWMTPLANKWLPRPRISHPWPDQRFDVRTQGKSRMR